LAALASAAGPGGPGLSYATLYAAPEFKLERAPAAAWLHAGTDTGVVPHATHGIDIGLDGVAKTVDTEPVLLDLSFEIGAGQFVAIVGRPHAGKTTLMRVMSGLEPVSAGRLEIDGEPVAGPRKDVRLLFREPRLLPWSRVLPKVGIGHGPEWQDQAQAALKAVGLGGHAHTWPLKLDAAQRHRVALARALVSKPKLLLMDEPFDALGADDRANMHELIQTVWAEQGFTAVLMTHDVQEALALADRVLVLKNGRIVRDTPINVPRRLRRASPALDHLEQAIRREI